MCKTLKMQFVKIQMHTMPNKSDLTLSSSLIMQKASRRNFFKISIRRFRSSSTEVLTPNLRIIPVGVLQRSQQSGTLTDKLGPDSPLNRLPYAENAPFNSFDTQHIPTCLPDTRVDVLQEVFAWADSSDERRIFWLNGLAGTGKSTIARTVARRYYVQECLAASFFFSRGGGDVSRASKFVTSIAVQLAKKSLSLLRYISEAITQHSNIATQSLRDQWQQLVLGPLSKLHGNPGQSSYILVVDALDECDDDNDIRTVLQLLAEARSLRTVRLRIFITSRPEIPIRHGFYQIPEAGHQDFVLHNISPPIVDHDIAIFLEYNLRLIREEFSLETSWPGEDAIKRLVQGASGLFIWAATACRFIREGRKFAADRLSKILNDEPSTDDCSTDDSATDGSSVDNSTIAPEEQLNKIYVAVLKNSIRNYKRQERKKWYKSLRETAGTIVLLSSPLSAFSLAGLLSVRREDIIQTLDDLHSRRPGSTNSPSSSFISRLPSQQR